MTFFKLLFAQMTSYFKFIQMTDAQSEKKSGAKSRRFVENKLKVDGPGKSECPLRKPL